MGWWWAMLAGVYGTLVLILAAMLFVASCPPRMLLECRVWTLLLRCLWIGSTLPILLLLYWLDDLTDLGRGLIWMGEKLRRRGDA